MTDYGGLSVAVQAEIGACQELIASTLGLTQMVENFQLALMGLRGSNVDPTDINTALAGTTEMVEKLGESQQLLAGVESALQSALAKLVG